jgi:hypothetical protein
MVARACVHRGLVQLDQTESVTVTVMPFDLFMMLLSALSSSVRGLGCPIPIDETRSPSRQGVNGGAYPLTQGVGAHLTNDEKRAHLADLKREHLID